ncbi:hypothetical protein ACQBAU_16295 [Propionibacteriaceae bacterium Y2011]
MTGAVAVAKFSAGGEGYFYRGSILPPSVDRKEAERLIKVGLVTKVADPKPAPQTPAPPAGGQDDQGKPDGDDGQKGDVDLEQLDLTGLREFAEQHQIDLGGADRADRARKVIAAALADN